MNPGYLGGSQDSFTEKKLGFNIYRMSMSQDTTRSGVKFETTILWLVHGQPKFAL